MKTLAIAALLVLVIAGLAHAGAVATLTLSVNASRWFVYAQVDTVANDGLAIIDFKVANVPTTPVPGFRAPGVTDYDADGFAAGIYGFNYGNAVNVIDTNTVEVIAGMNPALASSPYDLRGIGQGVVTFDSVGSDGSSVVHNTIAAKVLIAQGLYNWTMGEPYFTQTQAVDVWAAGSNEMIECQVALNGIGPEPATLSLLALGGLALLRRPRANR